MGCLCSTDTKSHLNLPKRTTSANRDSSLPADTFSQDLSLNKYKKNFYNDYLLKKKIIGSGAHGEIRLCVKKSADQIFAVKIINKAQLPQDVIKNNLVNKQVKMVLALDHSSILKINEFYEDQSNYFIIMDYFEGGDLLKKMQKFQYLAEPIAAKIMKQIFSALCYMHGKGIAHRDIKPENIIVELKSKEILVKVIDFDTAVSFGGKKLSDKQGSIYYMSPEVIKEEYDEKCDVWSAGVILYAMLTSCFPFYAESEAKTEELILGGVLNVKDLKEDGVSAEAIHLLSKLLEKNPKKRYSAQEAYSSGWILKNSQ